MRGKRRPLDNSNLIVKEVKYHERSENDIEGLDSRIGIYYDAVGFSVFYTKS